MYIQVGLVVTSEDGGVGPYFCTWKLVHANVLCMQHPAALGKWFAPSRAFKAKLSNTSFHWWWPMVGLLMGICG